MADGTGGKATREAIERRALLRRLLEARASSPAGGRLSAQQERLWVAHHLDPLDPSHNLRSALRIRGPLDVGQLEASISRLVSRHAQLRARFRQLEGRPFVEIAPEVAIRARRADLRESRRQEGSRSANWDSQIATEIRQEAARPFDLEAGPPIRLALFALSDVEHIAVLTIHHIVCDRWSMELLLRELCELYDAALTHRTPRLPDLPATYQDFSTAQAGALDGAAGEAMITFWRRELEGYQSVAILPPDRDPSAATHLAARRLSFTFAAGLSQRIDELARRHRATTFMVLLAAFGMLLRRLGSGTNLIVATPVANRHNEAWEALVGYFVNLLPLRLRFDDDDPFEAVITRLRRTVLEAHEHQQLPLYRIAQAADLRPAQLLRILYQHAANPPTSLTGGGASFEPQPIDLGVTHHDLALTTHVTANGLAGTLEYSRDLFSLADAESLASDLQSALEQLTTTAGIRATDLIVASTWRLPNNSHATSDRSSTPDSTAPPPDDPDIELTPTERALAEIWREVLGLDAVSAFDNFLDVGGDSLLAMQAIERAERTIGVRLGPADLFTQTLAQLAASCDNRRA